MELKDRLTALRKERELSQLDVADALGVTRQAISRWEVGSSFPTVDNLIALSKLYRIPMDMLIGNIDAVPPPNPQESSPSIEEEDVQTPPSTASRSHMLSRLLVPALIAAIFLWLGVFWMHHSRSDVLKLAHMERNTFSSSDLEIGDTIYFADDPTGTYPEIDSIDWDISSDGDGLKQNSKPFYLESDGTVTIACVSAPLDTELEFGLVGPDGLFYHTTVYGTSFQKTIQVPESRPYYLMFQNRSSDVVRIRGLVYF
ncbi:helix-turn-helix transcriptional regulator [Pseudoflavonifractor sp. MSJ-37]|uniref:helix-turn-helix transcriptional regulator n=1 Tax=Pseudoflavonifractor sp. MSJ-37 TaxID=2841531 RepID=UPI001C11282E|nr:helix-turn-helix transcriptional regulator [Pseudoflavonifractor sp. MSJ-37]MBU5436025.1 helix-turn-helix domain-containing protein [Pseudoflavonifractor sp. MSJ-37]